MDEFDEILSELDEMPQIQQLREFRQHGGTNTYDHSRMVALTAYRLARALGWKVDWRVLARGAMLHDYYLRQVPPHSLGNDYHHGVSHPQEALDNAERDFDLTDKERNIIRSHMWPLTFLHPPTSREAWLINLADDYVGAREMLKHHDLGWSSWLRRP